MIIGFIIWSVVAIIVATVGIVSWRSEKPAGFFAGVKAPEVNDTVKYNRAVGNLWFAYAGIFECFGIPFLFSEQNSAIFVIPVLGVVFLSIGLAVGYVIIAAKYQKKN